MDARIISFAWAQGWDVDVDRDDGDVFMNITIPSLEKTTARVDVSVNAEEAVDTVHAAGNVMITNNAISLIHQMLDSEVYRAPVTFEAPRYFSTEFHAQMTPEMFLLQIPWLQQPIPEAYSKQLQRNTTIDTRTKTLLLARVMGHTPFDDVSCLKDMILDNADKQVERLILHMIADVAKRQKLDDDDMLWWSEYVAHSTSRAARICQHALEYKPAPIPTAAELEPTFNSEGEEKSIPPEEKNDLFGRSLKTFAPYFMPRKTRARIEHCLEAKKILYERQGDWTIQLATVTIHLRRGMRALHIVMTPLHDDEVCLVRAWKCLY